jgi:hypothetical protein
VGAGGEGAAVGPRVEVARTPEARGPGKTRNLGIQEEVDKWILKGTDVNVKPPSSTFDLDRRPASSCWSWS